MKASSSQQVITPSYPSRTCDSTPLIALIAHVSGSDKLLSQLQVSKNK
jgi:hypothetical protein